MSSVNIDLSATADLPSPRISEIVLRTSRFDAMQEWYQLVLSAKPSFEYQVPGGGPHGENRAVDFHRLCFLRVYQEFPYSEVLALFEIPGLQAPSQTTGSQTTGLHHMQFRFPTLDALADRYSRLSPFGLRPYKAYNHGPSTNFYYEDPDGNLVELSGPNYSSPETVQAFFRSEGFAKNPAGVEIDPEHFVAALRDGADRDELVRLPA